jgi:hypothetical protein
MLMPQKQRVAIALLVLFVLWCGWQSKLSSQNTRNAAQQPSAQSSNAENTNLPKPHNDGGWTWITKDAGGFFTLCLVIVGVGQFVLFWVQLGFMRVGVKDAAAAAKAATKSAKTAEKSFVASQRPWVGIESISSLPLIVGLEPDVLVIVKNSGPGTAVQMKAKVTGVVSD